MNELIWTLKNRSNIIEALTTLPWDLKPEQVQYLTKRHLLRFSSSEIMYVWEHLPEKFKNDKKIQLRLPCFDHFNIAEEPTSKADCLVCSRELLRAKLNNHGVNFSYCCI